MNELRDKVLELVKRNGPILPVKIAKVIDKDVLFTSALLSELVSNKLIKLTHQNLGGSPLYYVLGQEGKLEVLYNALADKEKEAYSLLKKDGVLVDNELEPSIRVALRNLKDFAKLMKVNYKDTELMIWRWFLVDNKRFEELVKGFFVKKIVKPKEEIKEKLLEKVSSKEEVKEKIEQKKLVEPKVKVEKKKFIEPKVEKKREVLVKDDFLDRVVEYLRVSNITVLGSNIIKKNKEVDLFVKIHSGIGDLVYLVKAMDKRSISKADLIGAFHKGQEEKLPVLFLCTGKIAKKLEGNLEKEFRGFLMLRSFDKG